MFFKTSNSYPQTAHKKQLKLGEESKKVKVKSLEDFLKATGQNLLFCLRNPQFEADYFSGY